jgi:Carboxylesterase family
MRQTMCRLWTNFAKFHDPTPNHDHDLTVKWSSVQPLTSANSKKIVLDYLMINDELKMVRNFKKIRMDFWRKIDKFWDEDFLISKL